MFTPLSKQGKRILYHFVDEMQISFSCQSLLCHFLISFLVSLTCIHIKCLKWFPSSGTRFNFYLESLKEDNYSGWETENQIFRNLILFAMPGTKASFSSYTASNNIKISQNIPQWNGWAGGRRGRGFYEGGEGGIYKSVNHVVISFLYFNLKLTLFFLNY